MTKPEVVHRLAMIEAIPEWVETEIDQGHIRLEEVELIRSAIDDAEIRIWGLLADGNAGKTRFVEQVRLRRAIEICRDVSNDLSRNTIGIGHTELPVLRQVAQQLVVWLNLTLTLKSTLATTRNRRADGDGD